MKRLFSVFCVASLLATAVFAQIPGQPSRRGQQPPAAIDPLTGLPVPSDPGPRFDLDFQGGQPADLIKAIEKHSQARPNVVIHPECATAMIPPFRLRDVTVAQVLNTLNSLAEPDYKEGAWRQVPMQDGEVWTLTKTNPRAGYGMPGMQGGFGQYPISQQAPPQPRSCKIFNLTPYLDMFTVEDITTAVQGAWDLMKTENDPSIKYHKDTKLLIVVGAITEINVVADVLQRLMESIEFKQNGGVTPAPKPATKPEAAAPSPKRSQTNP